MFTFRVADVKAFSSVEITVRNRRVSMISIVRANNPNSKDKKSSKQCDIRAVKTILENFLPTKTIYAHTVNNNVIQTD